MRKILLSQKTSEEAMAILEGVGEVVQAPEGDLAEFTRLLKNADAVLLGTSVKLTSELMDSAPELRVISRTGVGVDNVDVRAATDRGILVLNTPDANTVSVAEHTVALIAAIAKQLLFLDRELRQGNFQSRRLYLPVDLDGKVLGLVGCGRIGRMVAQKCISAFNMRVIGYDPYPVPAEGIELCQTIEEVFARADYISVHVPFTESTKNLIDERLLSLMKPTAYLINTARGGIVREDALARKLKNKEIAGAALDVFSSEPPEVGNELLSCPNVILTPHSAALTRECTVRVSVEAAQGIADFFRGKTPRSVVNREVLEYRSRISSPATLGGG